MEGLSWQYSSNIMVDLNQVSEVEVHAKLTDLLLYA
jgi:hypothetical protein